jgi:hypothetical protein
MLQIATFTLPDENDNANAFLRTHKPFGEIARMGDLLFIAYEDGTYPPEYEIAELQELIAGQRAARLQLDIALHVLKAQLADLNPRHNKGRYEELMAQKFNVQAQIDNQELKIAFVQGKIDALRKANGKEGN